MYDLLNKIEALQNFESKNIFVKRVYKDIKPLIEDKINNFFDVFELWEAKAKELEVSSDVSNYDLEETIKLEEELEALQDKLEAIEEKITDEFEAVRYNLEFDFRTASELYNDYGSVLEAFDDLPLEERAKEVDCVGDLLIRICERAYENALYQIYDF